MAEAMGEFKSRETAWATLEPDCYGGENCDEIIPQWHTFFDGDKDADYIREPLLLDGRLFPPGTRVVISVPMCPQCEETRGLKYPMPKTGPAFNDKCQCGFDWHAWTLEHFS